MKQPQLNLRFPEEHHDLIRKLAERLRADPAFAEYLEDLLNQPTPPVLPPLQQRLDAALAEIRLMAEGYLEEFGRAKAEVQQSLAGIQAEQQHLLNTFQASLEQIRRGPASEGDLVVMRGGLKRLTEAGIAEVTRRLALGEQPDQIAAAVGIEPRSVRKWRTKLTGRQPQAPA